MGNGKNAGRRGGEVRRQQGRVERDGVPVGERDDEARAGSERGRAQADGGGSTGMGKEDE
ncbi:MAG: hypothetical protein J6V52_02410 [Bacteroidaceae bacterium]|nr:hypothetical protein [Bacteroidaceae bacterium]